MIIQEMEERTTKNGKPYFFITIDGVKMSAWPNQLGAAKTGDQVQASWEQNGQYTNLKTLEITQQVGVGNPTGGVEISTGKSNTAPKRAESADLLVECLKIAATVSKDGVQAIQNAETFVKWCRGEVTATDLTLGTDDTIPF